MVQKIKMTIKEVVSAAINICIFSDILSDPKSNEVTLHVDDVCDAIDMLIEENVIDENYEVCKVMVDAKLYVQKPDFCLDKFLKTMKYE